MKVRRLLPWLGWVLAGVLAVSAAGTALASAEGDDAKAAAALLAKDGDRQEQRVEKQSKLRQLRLLRRGLHGEVTVRGGKDANGKPTFVQAVFARGEVAGLSGDTLSVRSADGVVTAFTLAGDTKLRQRGEDVARSALRAGVPVFAVGKRDGQAVTAVRVVVLAKP
jgi:hypothetical protein